MTGEPLRVGLPKLAFDAALVYAGTLVSLTLGFITKVLLARAISPFDLGLLLTGQTIVGLAQTLGQLTLPDTVARFVGLYAAGTMGQAKRVLLDAFKINLGATALTVLVLVANAGFTANVLYGQPRLKKVLLWLALSIPFVTLAETLAAASRGLGQIWVKVLCVDIARLLWVILAVGTLVLAGLNSLLAVTAAYASANLVAGLLTGIAFWGDPRWLTHTERTPKGETLRYNLPLLANRFVAWPSTLIPLWLGSLVSPQIVTYFSLAATLSNFIYMPVIAVEFAILPVWTRLISQGDQAKISRLYVYTTRWCFILGSAVFVLLFLRPATVLTVLYGPAYVDGAPVLQIVAVTILAGAITGTNNSLLYAFGHTRQIFIATAAGGAVALVGTFPLIKAWGLAGGLAVFAMSQFLGIALYAIFLFRKQRIHPLDRNYLKTLLAGGGALIVVVLVQGSLPGGLWGAATVVGLYTALLFAGLVVLRAFDEQDARLIRRAWALLAQWVLTRKHAL